MALGHHSKSCHLELDGLVVSNRVHVCNGHFYADCTVEVDDDDRAQLGLRRSWTIGDRRLG
jgi:hypothetical protein